MSRTVEIPTPLAAAQEEQAAAVLTAALRDDPVSHYLVGAASEDAAALHRFYAATVRLGLRYGEVITLGAIDGVAVWLPPGGTTVTPIQMLRSGLIGTALRLGWSPLRRMMRMAAYVEAMHGRAAPGPHWHLMVVGVDPARQGQGLGGALIAPVLSRADAAGLPCYLESMNERNLSFYRKHGFEAAAEGVLPGTDLHVWAMVREPRQPVAPSE